jgi:hypothetical protein
MAQKSDFFNSTIKFFYDNNLLSYCVILFNWTDEFIFCNIGRGKGELKMGRMIQIRY